MKRATATIVFTIAVASSLLQGCGEPPSSETTTESYYFNVLESGWDTVIYINGNPASRGGSAASVVQEMSPWMKIGSNTIQIITKRVGADASDCDIRFVKLMDPMDPNSAETLNGIHHSPADAEQYEVQFQVVLSRNPATWLWQRAKSLEGFTDADRAKIAELLKNAADALAQKNPGLYLERMTPAWGDGPWPASLRPTNIGLEELEKKRLEILERICSYSDFVVTVAPQKEWEYLVGKRVVMVCRKPITDPSIKNCILYAGHSPDYEAQSGEVTWSISRKQIHFLWTFALMQPSRGR